MSNFDIGSHVDLVFSPPQDADSQWSPEAATFGFEGDLNSPTTLTATFQTRFDVVSMESDPANPLQLKSYCEVLRFGVREWRGLIFSRKVLLDSGGLRTVEIQAIDIVGWLRRVLACWQGNGKNEYYFTLATPGLVQTSINLFQLDAIGDAQYVYAPEFDDSADPSTGDPPVTSMWLPNANSNTVQISEDIDGTFADGDSIRGPVVGSLGASSMLPGGIIRITTGGVTEYIQYDGYIDRSDGFWYFNNIKRGVCGTSAIDHDNGDDAYQCQSKRVDLRGIIELTGTGAGGTDVIEDKHYELNPDDGFIYFSGNPGLIAPDDDEPYTSFDLDEYTVFDETNTAAFTSGGRLLMSYLFEQLLESTGGGPAFTGADYEVSISPDIVLTRVHLGDNNTPEGGEFLLDLFEKILAEQGLNKGSTTDAIGILDSPSANKVKIKSITQADTPTLDSLGHPFIFETARAVSGDTSLESINGAIMVNYRSAQPRNLASAARSWFSELQGGTGFEDSVGSNTEIPIGYQVQPASDSDPSWGAVGTGFSNVNHQGAHLMFDGNENTAYGLAWLTAENPGSDCEVFYFHFSDTLDESFNIKRIRINYDIASSSNATNLASLRVYGLRGFVPGTTSAAPTYTERVDLSYALRQKYKEGDTTRYDNAILEADNIGVDCEAIVLVWDGMPIDGSHRVARIREVRVEGAVNRQVLVQITDQDSALIDGFDSTYIYAPLTYAKIYDAKTGLALIDRINVGAASYNAAVSFGRLALVQALALSQVQDFLITTRFRAIPDFGDTVMFFPGTPEEFIGVVISKSYQCDNEESLTLGVIDFRSEIFGT